MKLGSSLLLALASPGLLGLGETVSASSHEHDDEMNMAPTMKTFGYEYKVNPISGNTDLAVDMRANFDIGANYELPFYTQEQYYIGRQRFGFFLGGRQYVTVTAYPLRFSFYLDIYPVRAIFENYMSVDLLGTTGAWCWYGSFLTDIIRILLYMQIDYTDCKYGILGFVIPSEFASPSACQWQTYYVNKPIFDLPIVDGGESEVYRSAGCEARTI